MKEFRGADIPGIYNLSSLTDKTLYVFRNRFVPYMAITLCTFGVFSLGIAWAFVGNNSENLLEHMMDNPMEASLVLQRYFYFLIIPTVIADLAIQEYTSRLVRGKEITWLQAISKVFSVNLLNYALVRAVGFGILYIVSTVTVEIMMVLVIGQVIYLQLVAGISAMFVGMAHAIVVEERLNFLSVIGRNLKFATSNLGLVAFGSFAGLMIILGLTFCGAAFIYFAGLIIFNLLHGTNTNPVEYFGPLTSIVVYGFPILIAIFFIPLANIFYSVMYYHFRSLKEGFHLENEVNIALKEELKNGDLPGGPQAEITKTTA